MVTQSNYVTRNTTKNRWVLSIDLDPRLLLILLAFCEKNIVRYALLVLSMIPVIGGLSKLVLPVLYIVLILLCLYKGSKMVRLQEVSFLLFAISAIGLSCLLYPENAKYILDKNNFWNTIFPCLRWYIVGLVMIPDSRTMKILGKAACLAVLLESAFVLLYMLPNGLFGNDEMNRAYQILPNILIVIYYAFSEKRKMPWLFMAMGILYLLAMGTRGPLIIMLIYLLIKLLKASSAKMWIRVFFGGLIGGICVAFVNSAFYITMLENMKTIFSNMGLSTRVIDFAIEGTTFSYTSGRDRLFEQSLQLIGQKPFFGYGVYGDWPIFYWNCHNIYLEFMIHFGVVLGIFLLLWTIWVMVKAYFKTPNENAKEMILIFACFIYVRGFFGGSWIHYSMFFAIAFCLKEIYRIKSKKYAEHSNYVKL